MSYSGTVTCSYCYKQGHNRRKCPELTARYKQNYTTHMEAMINARDNSTQQYQKMSDEDRGWYVKYYAEKAEKDRQAYMKRTKIDLATGKKVTNKAAKAARMKNVTCSYCGNTGHTRRTCKDLKNDQEIYRRMTIEGRRQYVERLAALQIGPGSMVVRSMYGPCPKTGAYIPQKLVGMITGLTLKPEHLNGSVLQILGRTCVIQAKTNQELRGGKHDWRFNFDDLSVRKIEESRAGQEESEWMVSGSSSASLSVPDNFYDPSTVDVKAHFPTGESRPWNYKWGHTNDEDPMAQSSIIVRHRAELEVPQCEYDGPHGRFNPDNTPR